jgi:pilus assembly protein CpaC
MTHPAPKNRNDKLESQTMAHLNQALLRCTLLTAVAISSTFAALSPAVAEEANDESVDSPSFVSVGLGKGMTLRLPRPAKNVFVADPSVANINPVSNQLVYLFGKKDGETTIYAVDNNDRVIYSATVRVANNLQQLSGMLKVAMPNATIDVKPVNGLIFLTGSVASPAEIEEAGRLAQQLVGKNQQIINKLTSKTPVQVMLQVKFAEVNRDTLKTFSTNANATDTTGGFGFGLFRGRKFLDQAVLSPTAPGGGLSQAFVLPGENATSLFGSGALMGLNILGSVDALEQVGLLSVLAEPTLTALSGEKASFLAGGEFPITVPQPNGAISVEFKEYGVQLSFVPVVHSGNRISMKVSPEVSQLSASGAITLNNISIPALTTRKAETTVELGSGESFMIAGLLQNSVSNDVSRLPGIGNLPILGALFKSDRFRRQETELMIVVTPYIVKPVNSGDIKLPTDGFQAPSDLQRYLLGKTFSSGLNKSNTAQNAKSSGAMKAASVATTTDQSASVRPGLTFGN